MFWMPLILGEHVYVYSKMVLSARKIRSSFVTFRRWSFLTSFFLESPGVMLFAFFLHWVRVFIPFYLVVTTLTVNPQNPRVSGENPSHSTEMHCRKWKKRTNDMLLSFTVLKILQTFSFIPSNLFPFSSQLSFKFNNWIIKIYAYIIHIEKNISLFICEKNSNSTKNPAAFGATQVKPKSRHSRIKTKEKRWIHQLFLIWNIIAFHRNGEAYSKVLRQEPRENSSKEMKTKYNEDRGKRVSNIDLLESLPQRHFTSSLSFIHISLVLTLVSRTHTHTRRNFLRVRVVNGEGKNARKWKW